MTTSATESRVESRTDGTVPPPRVGASSPATAVRDVVRRVHRALQGEAVLVAVLVSSFLARWLIADRNSYWLDELLSVARYGVWNDSAAAAVQRLADGSVHPPLYQFILYYWMDWFGDGERATRSLSNLFITLATLFLFLLVRDAFSRRIALASAIAFALMYTPVYYALETRSYAQTIALVTLSSYALLRVMRTGTDAGWRSALWSPGAALFMVANVALLLTHFFNAFFLAAQAAMAAVFVLRERSPRDWLPGVGTVALMYALQAGVFALSWGPMMAGALRRQAATTPATGDPPGPIELLSEVVAPNLAPPALVRWLGLALMALVAVRAVVTLAGRGVRAAERRQAWTVAYLVGWLLVPLLIGYATLMITGVTRYSERYWTYLIPPLAPLVVLAVEAVADLVRRAWRRASGRGLPAGWTTVGIAVVIATLVLPGTLAAASDPKADWRGTAQDIVEIIEGDPESRYLVYETSFSTTPILDYYLSRYSSDIRVGGIIRRSEEDRGEAFVFERDAEVVAQYDYLIVPFIHHRTTNFPRALERLSERYDVHLWHIDDRHTGLVIFAVPGRGETATESGQEPS